MADLPRCPECRSPLFGTHDPENGCPIICVWNGHVLTREETRQPPCMLCQYPGLFQALEIARGDDGNSEM